MRFIPIAIITILLAALSGNYIARSDNTMRPTNAKEYAATAVKILNKENTHGGTGVILHSDTKESTILTNNHVCRLLEAQGGIVLQEDFKYVATGIKKSKRHDVCMVKVDTDLKINTVLAAQDPEKYSPANVSGFPHLYPHITTHGYFSGHYPIQLANGSRPCTKEDLVQAYKSRDIDTFMECAVFKNIATLGPPIDTQVISGTVAGGSSGSAVFTARGEIAALIFAKGGGDGIDYGFAVPFSYVKTFVEVEAPNMNWTLLKK